ncbi:Cof-type HAD-IIB family hydrolase [Pseudoleptotrichia goodfellowii]|jgi:cof-like hydrolase|uniref:Cof-like hydrolase n=2 Tax=Pseudoleptotrichia goodfellowii TaxID=157692 RepID=D0GIC9_9FUSO|nr:Cof-type HAD-IIB family hydrolase [Pseudoleptotrichia goodfellowii]EEY36124.1 Cof-like hydrolase [Pseudoleptotrichia goodfellowii F0264]BBM35579.1 cof family hydrolase [Pseudoleptotrichia goodfellowii]
MDYKLIATDMDGTLLNDRHLISEGNVQAIKEVQKKGVKFVLASGRPSFAMLNYAKKLEMDKNEGYVLAFNGGQLINMSDGKVMFHEGLNKEDIEKVYNASKEIGLPMVLYAGDTVYANGNSEYVQFEVNQCEMKFVEFKSLEELYGYGIKETTKCMIIGNGESVKKAEKYMKSKYEKDYFIAISAPIFLEIANKNINKGKTLKKLGEITGIDTSEMIAVGDSYNDAPLLEVVGMPVAVENAVPKIKEMSKFESTSNNNDALKTVIEEFFMK